MRSFAIASVILIHATDPFYDPSGSSALFPQSWACAIAKTFTRWCVPVFFMLSGALLLDPARAETARDFYRRRFSRIGIPILFWSAFYIARSIVVNGTAIRSGEYARRLVAGEPGEGFHLWFVYALLGLYAAMPALKPMFLAASRSNRWQLAVGCLVLASSAAMGWTFEGLMGWRIPPNPVFLIEWVPYLGYFLLGYLIRGAVLSRTGVLAAAASWCGIASLCAVGYKMAASRGQAFQGEGLYMSYLSPPIMALSIAAFLLLATLCRGPIWQGRIVRQLGEASFGAYLVHLFVLRMMMRVPLSPYARNTAGGLLCRWLVAVAASYALSAILLKIPVARKVVGG